jgi:hypothetical protein
MEKLNELLTDQASTKRFLTMLVSVLIIALNQKLGLGLGEFEQGAIVTIVVSFLLASNAKEAAIKKAEVAADAKKTEATVKVSTTKDALDQMGAG